MPRDLSALANDRTLQDMSSLSKVSERDSSYEQSMSQQDEDQMIATLSQRSTQLDELHPYTQTLSLSDIESCVVLENAAFPPEERASREKFQYRLKHCSELCLGIFSSQENSDAATAETSAPVFSGEPQRKAVLLGHVIATKAAGETVTDDDMAVPAPGQIDPKLGHKEHGRTICIHSLAVLPEYQHRGLGKTIVKAYLQRMQRQEVADRVALIAHDYLVTYYEQFGFVNKGESAAQFGGGGWIDMVSEFELMPTSGEN
ncbi:related to polyamine acetyltransferase [Ramularia collo-cygni]|uniref:Related to polyamine acetyltransferase n=1 Tax=Ramularia collo-cygni TaxID=112498 RepID=A0A2D3UR41_9PEZI|nr:related to polyamine acetyltransferase [Ramularia collo-cygni]CZT19512.1 related to polyamine acetyltransferase [Ramularia collo-cygni]